MPPSPRDPRPAGYDDWLRALSRAMADEGARGAAEHRAADAAPPAEEVLDAVPPGEGLPVSQPAPLREQRVWDLCKPHLVPVAVAVAVGMVLVGFLVSTVNWFFPRVPPPSPQTIFDAQWDAHRRGTDIAAPEVLQDAAGKAEEKPQGP